MKNIAALARAQGNEEQYELWELVVWGRKMYGED